jgi:hypothetical protein
LEGLDKVQIAPSTKIGHKKTGQNTASLSGFAGKTASKPGTPKLEAAH